MMVIMTEEQPIHWEEFHAVGCTQKEIDMCNCYSQWIPPLSLLSEDSRHADVWDDFERGGSLVEQNA